MKLTDKVLLLTGGSNFAEDILSFTKPNGIKLIATGTGAMTPLKKISDEVFDIDTTDVEAMTELCKERCVNGIFAGGNETNIITAIKVSEKLGLPYYCNIEQWNTLMNKSNFKKLCREFDIPVTKEYSISCLADVENTEVEFPVIVKPVDSCGSKGVIYCENYDELKKAVKEALLFSASGNVIVEQYVTGEEISATYTICNGNITLSCMKEKYPVAEQSGLMNMPNVFIYPSKYLQRYIDVINDKAIKMLKSLNLKFGTLFLQGFVNHSGIYMFEAGYRPGGTNDFRYTDMMNGVNHMHMLIEQALTGCVEDDLNSRDNPKFRQYCCSFTMCARGGRVCKISGIDKLSDIDEIKNVEQFYHEGDSVPFGKTLAQRMLRFFIMADDLDKVSKIIETIQKNVRVTGENGENILYGDFDVKRLY